MDKGYLVLNNNKTQGFYTTDKQLAYEVRKGAETNCYTSDGYEHEKARQFCIAYGDEDCTIVEIEV